MTIDYQFEPAEIRALAKERQHPTPAAWSRLYYFGILPALTVGLAAEIQSFTIAAVFTLLFIATGWCIQERSRQSFWREVYSDENLSFSTRRRSVTLTSDGIRDSSDAAEILYRWPFVRQVQRSSRYILLELTPLQSLLIPVRAFRDEGHIQEFIALAKTYVKHTA